MFIWSPAIRGNALFTYIAKYIAKWHYICYLEYFADPAMDKIRINFTTDNPPPRPAGLPQH